MPWFSPTPGVKGPGAGSQGPELLARSPSWSPDDGALLIIAPRPDDEILGAGGLIRTWAASGREVTVLSVLDGEAGGSGAAGPATARREELDALRKLCPTHVSVTRLGLPRDGKMTAHLNRMRNAMLPFCRERLTLIAPYEHNAHPDHDTVGSLCLDFARSQNIPIARYAIGAWAGAMGKERWVRFALSDDAKRAKARAIACFRPRTAASAQAPLPADGFDPLDYEAFVLPPPKSNDHHNKPPKGERPGGVFHGEESTRDLSQKTRFLEDG